MRRHITSYDVIFSHSWNSALFCSEHINSQCHRNKRKYDIWINFSHQPKRRISGEKEKSDIFHKNGNVVMYVFETCYTMFSLKGFCFLCFWRHVGLCTPTDVDICIIQLGSVLMSALHFKLWTPLPLCKVHILCNVSAPRKTWAMSELYVYTRAYQKASWFCHLLALPTWANICFASI